MDDKQRKQAAAWVDELCKENPETPRYLLETMVETYILNPVDAEKIIMSYK